MAKLYFRYGAMSSSKTANALMVRYNYSERGQNALLVKPEIDTRDGKHTLKSRCGLESECVLFHEMPMEDIRRGAYDCIIVDEAQFLSKNEVQTLADIVDDYNVPVICYGLRADFQGNFLRAASGSWRGPTASKKSKPSAGAEKKLYATRGWTARAA